VVERNGVARMIVEQSGEQWPYQGSRRREGTAVACGIASSCLYHVAAEATPFL
jgi:hypothetical protein